jgi:glycine/D-amino acid oxidase-like deaminating enzyme
VRGVETTDGRVDSDAVVLANGIGAVDLLQPLGIDFGLAPRSVQYARFASPAPLPPDLPAVLDDSQAFWFRASGGEIITGLEFVPPGLLSNDEARHYAALCRRKLQRRLNVGRPPASAGYGTATVGMSPDGRPIVDRVAGLDGLFVMVGDSGISLKFAPISGRCVAEWYTTGSPRSADLSPFSAARLQDGPPAVTLRPGGHRRTIHLLRELQAAAAESPD